MVIIIIINALANVKLYTYSKKNVHHSFLSLSKSRQYMMKATKKMENYSQRPQNLHFFGKVKQNYLWKSEFLMMFFFLICSIYFGKITVCYKVKLILAYQCKLNQNHAI